MKSLSIKQPWASLIAHGIKDIENRTWKTNFRGRIYIHASGSKVGFDNWYDSPLNNEQLLSLPTANYGLDFDYSAIIGEVDIVDCVINHLSIWAEKTDVSKLRQTTSGIFVDKPIYNWVLANPVLYDKPILNVKGKLSFWEWHGCEQTCESCEKDFDIDTMQRDGDDNFFCKLCADELFPIMQAEYEEMVAKGEIEPDDD